MGDRCGGDGMEEMAIRVLVLGDLPLAAWGLAKLVESRQPQFASCGVA